MKAKVLKALRESEEFLSGQQLCSRLGVSRTAVWKVITQLKEEGYQIESVRNKGYRLLSAPDIYSESEIKSRLRTKKLAQKLLFFDELDSTNTFCRQNGDKYPDGTLVIANTQTAGKGSRGRGWESPENVSVYMTVLLKPEIRPEHAPRLTPVMALSIVRALRTMGIEAGIKWPNDVVMNGRKLVGILTEMSAEIDYIHQVIIGAGINVLTEQFPEEIAQRATSLLLETGKRFSRSEIAAEIMNCFEEDYHIFLKTCDLSGLLEAYRRFSVTVGNQVRVMDRKGEYTGRALDVDSVGQLLVEKEDGSRVKVFADEVSVRGLYGYV